MKQKTLPIAKRSPLECLKLFNEKAAGLSSRTFLIKSKGASFSIHEDYTTQVVECRRTGADREATEAIYSTFAFFSSAKMEFVFGRSTSSMLRRRRYLTKTGRGSRDV